jgi:hypothetical protein
MEMGFENTGFIYQLALLITGNEKVPFGCFLFY